jgi:hypothetical protein
MTPRAPWRPMAACALCGLLVIGLAVALSAVWLLLVGTFVLALAPVGFLLPALRRPPER